MEHRIDLVEVHDEAPDRVLYRLFVPFVRTFVAFVVSWAVTAVPMQLDAAHSPRTASSTCRARAA